MLDPHTDVLVHRYRRASDGAVSFIECAAFTSSYVDKMFADGRKKAAAALVVDEAILNKLGQLSSAVGELQTVRKIDKGWDDRPHTSQEWEWMRAAVPLLIRRVSQLAATPGQQPQKLTMADLPPL